MCRCGSNEFERQEDGGSPVGLKCRRCGLSYSVKKLEKRTRVTNLPMSFGFRSLYWNKIESTGSSLFGITEEGYEIRERKEES